MSIIQEALKKVEHDYPKKETPAPSGVVKQDIATQKTYKKAVSRTLRKKERPEARRLIFILSAVLIAALSLRLFLLYADGARLKKPVLADSALSKPVAAAPEPSPEPPKIEPAIPETIVPRPPLFVLNGVMYLDGRPQAIINGYILEVGDSINGATLLEINENYVLLNVNEAKVKLGLNK